MTSSWTTLNVPSVGDATRQSLAADIVGNLEYLKGKVDGVTVTQGILNGSFETDTDLDGVPDNWTANEYASGTIAVDDTEQTHGLSSLKFSTAGTGAGYVSNNEFFEVNPASPLLLKWHQKSSAANVRNKVDIYWYKSDKTTSDTPSTNIFDREADNPTDWAKMFGGAFPPSDAAYAKIRITGVESSLVGTSGSISGTTWYDDVSITLNPYFQEMKLVNGAPISWLCPTGVYRAFVIATGGGGGGGSTNFHAGGGGGTGMEFIDVVPGTRYTGTVGSGGAATNGGTATSFQGVVGNGGGAGSGAGTGGTGTGDFYTESGETGNDAYYTGGSFFHPGITSSGPGYQGSGAMGTAGSGATGGDGVLVIRY